mgnify:CR=1 FL=1
MFLDESHQMIGQLNAMYNGDRQRKTTLVEYGFRLPSALDNRPLKFEEFERRMRQAIFVSATPADYEKQHAGKVVEQLVRPTGLVDPVVEVRPAVHQVDDVLQEIRLRVERLGKSAFAADDLALGPQLAAQNLPPPVGHVGRQAAGVVRTLPHGAQQRAQRAGHHGPITHGVQQVEGIGPGDAGRWPGLDGAQLAREQPVGLGVGLGRHGAAVARQEVAACVADGVARHPGG